MRGATLGTSHGNGAHSETHPTTSGSLGGCHLRSTVYLNSRFESRFLEKAALLAQVINHVKKLKKNAAEISEGYTIASDVDEVRVEVEGDAMKSGSFIVKASLCCEEGPEILTDLRQTLQSLHLKIIRAEISTLGGRVKNVLVMTSDGSSGAIDKHVFVATVHQGLKSILDRVNSQLDFLPRTSFSSKRRRISPFESSSSSSSLLY
ncbi:hypothetical protein BHM03_00028573 [Ensete ventricosum]|nr:hypothetical protein BHM03_00028573 [Ensete ventricosum]